MNHDSAAFVRCEGWWEQGWLGRQSMEDLRLSFDDGRIQGSGTDIVGPFTFSGIIATDGAVAMRKHYIGSHDVGYPGVYDGEGLMSGVWRIGAFQGPWMIRILRFEDSEVAGIRKIVPPDNV